MRIDLIRALLPGLGVKRKLQAAARFLLGHLPTEEMSCRKKQNRTEKRNQNPSCICLGNRRNARIPMTLVVVALPMMLVAAHFTEMITRVEGTHIIHIANIDGSNAPTI